MVIRRRISKKDRQYNGQKKKRQTMIYMRRLLNTTLCDKDCQYQWQVGGFLRVLRFPPPITLITTI